MTPRIHVLALALLLPACGDDKGATSQASSTSDGTTGGSTTSQPTSTSTTDATATATGGTTTDGGTSGPTTGGADPGIKEDCDARVAADLQATTYSCGCAVEEGMYLSVDDCLAATGHDAQGQAAAACACEIAATDPSSASPEACRRAKFEAFAACLAPLMCSDSSGRQACFDALLDGASCGFGSKQTDGQISLQCDGAPSSMCGSGETIPDYWTCDGESDCMDGSDEKNC